MEKFMELHLSDGWYLLNPREIRTVKYFQRYNDKDYSPDEKFYNLTDDEKKEIKKFVRIELLDRTDNTGKRYPNIMEIDVQDDKLFKYVYQKLSRKFNLNYRNKKMENDTSFNNILKLYQRGLKVNEIAHYLNLEEEIIEYIIEEDDKKKRNDTSIDHILKLYRQGWLVNEIARYLNLEEDTIGKIIEDDKKKINDNILKLYQQGWIAEEIADAFILDKETIEKIIEENKNKKNGI